MASDSSNQRALAGTPTRLPRSGDRTGRPNRVRRVLFHTLPGRLLVIGGSVKLFTWLLRVVAGVEIPALDAFGSLGSVGVIVGLAYFLWKLIVRAQRRLLWRVRRKLILSYIFVGVVPVLLVVAFFLLAGLLLFLNVGAYLVVSSIHGVADDALLLAQTMASDLAPSGGRDSRELLERKRASLARQYPEASIAVVPTSSEPCAGAAADAGAARPRPGTESAGALATKERPTLVAVGPWTHLAAPKVLPAWVSCTGFAGLLAVSPSPSQGGEGGIGLMVRAAGLPRDLSPAFAVVIDIPLDVTLKSRIRDETSVKLGEVSVIPPAGGESVPPAQDAGGDAASLLRLAAGDTSAKRRFPWVAVLDWWDWTTGRSGGVTANLEMNLGDVYEHVLGRSLSFFGNFFLYVLAILGVLFLIIEVVALLMGLILARSITGSVHQLFAGTARVREGDFGHKIRIRTRDQMGELAESFNSMTGSIEELLRQAEEKKRLEEELRIARAVQMSLLPRGDIVVPGLSITALCVPAREVGGDYYDLLPLDDGRLGVLIADVSGKGTSAAFYMAELKGIILSLCRIHRSPRQLLIEANRIIADNLDSRSFITMTYAVIDLQARTMTYARAGHTPLIHCTTDGSGPQVRVLAPDGLVVGLKLDDGRALFERLLKEETIPLLQGDLFMFFTDGITEAMNHASDCFGETRLTEILAEHGDLPSEELRERILREIDAFVAGAPQHDDMTMILVKVEPVGARVEQQALMVPPV
jgi:sigma-B regulation protein RsbU (phosphoserine phosphatase)